MLRVTAAARARSPAALPAHRPRRGPRRRVRRRHVRPARQHRRTFDSLLGERQAGSDVAVRGAGGPTSQAPGTTGPRRPPLSWRPGCAALPGVARVRPDIQGTARSSARTATAVRNGGAPSSGSPSRPDRPDLHLVQGRRPPGRGEVVVETSTLAKAGLAVGDQTRPLIGGGRGRDRRRRGRRSGRARRAPPSCRRPGDGAAARPGRHGRLGQLTAGTGVGRRSPLRARVAAVLPAERGGGDRAELADEADRASSEALGFFTTFLLVFAAVITSVRRRVHHLQHLLDAGRPAHPGAGPAAGGRSRRGRSSAWSSVRP